jgi:hypothetical protein
MSFVQIYCVTTCYFVACRVLTESIQDWVCQKYNATKTTSRWEMMFRPALRWLDRNAENLMTEALKEVKI